MKEVICVLTLCVGVMLPLQSYAQLVKILSIGNSFSEDAVENYLYDLAKAGGRSVIIGNLCIGGCSLERHLDNALNEKAEYEYRKIDVDGKHTNRCQVMMKDALKDEDWDYISFQEVSYLAGVVENYLISLPSLLDYVKGHVKNDSVTYVLHQTWAYAINSTRAGFEKYDKEQMKMYQAIVHTADSVVNALGLDMLIPSGTAIQNGRTSSLGDVFCRDGFHLNYGVGRFTVACTWFEKIFKANVLENSFAPENLSAKEIEIAKKSAHYAVSCPNAVSLVQE